MDRFSGANHAADIGAGRRGFRDRNLAQGLAGSVPDAAFLNGVQEEIVRAVERTGQAPSAADREQLAKAVLRAAGGNARVVTANTGLTADDAGLVVINAAGGPIAIFLPAASAAGGVSIPFVFARIDATANAVNVQRAGADLIEGQTFFGVLRGDRTAIRSDGASNWRYEVGTWANRALQQNGWQFMPGGLVLQWGSVTMPASGGTVALAAVAFPIAFPQAAFGVVATGGLATHSGSGYGAVCTVTNLSATGFAMSIDNNTGGLNNTPINQTVPVRWLAVGW